MWDWRGLVSAIGLLAIASCDGPFGSYQSRLGFVGQYPTQINALVVATIGESASTGQTDLCLDRSTAACLFVRPSEQQPPCGVLCRNGYIAIEIRRALLDDARVG
ncbi:MAG: hypothetical protein ABL932_23780, partial [Terricaulis sp.]